MKTNDLNDRILPGELILRPRREFLRIGLLTGSLAGVAGFGLLQGCKDEEENEVTPTEDLMREHGLLNRVMLIYDACILHLQQSQQFPVGALNEAATVIKSFIEDYHEKLEEDFLFPRFTNANVLVDLVQLLYVQHAAGRKLTVQIIQSANDSTLKNTDEAKKLVTLLADFNRMYRPHEAREDTVLFPALKSIVSAKDYAALGEEFEKKEHELFGQEGFEGMVTKVEGIEKQLGIFDLSAFTPAV